MKMPLCWSVPLRCWRLKHRMTIQLWMSAALGVASAGIRGTVWSFTIAFSPGWKEDSSITMPVLAMLELKTTFLMPSRLFAELPRICVRFHLPREQ